MSDSGQEHRVITGNGNLMPPWKKGQSGNPGGRPKSQVMTADLKALALTAPDGKSLSEAMAKKAFQMALKGNFQFWNAIMDRIDGKVPDEFVGEIRTLEMKFATLSDVEKALERRGSTSDR